MGDARDDAHISKPSKDDRLILAISHISVYRTQSDTAMTLQRTCVNTHVRHV